jgi:hypothetical protein
MVGLSRASIAELMEGYSMRLDIGFKDDWVVDPRDLASRLGVSAAQLERMERQGQVDARITNGTGEDAGLTRVTVRLLFAGWSGTFDQSGALVAEELW